MAEGSRETEQRKLRCSGHRKTLGWSEGREHRKCKAKKTAGFLGTYCVTWAPTVSPS